MQIQREQKTEEQKVYPFEKEAFASAKHANGNEQDLVVALRKSDAFVPELSLVAEVNGKLVGYLLFSEARVGEDMVLVLAPLAVKPNFQRQGVGSTLIIEGHRLAKALNYSHAFVLGSEDYYPRFGYRPAENLELRCHKDGQVKILWCFL